MPDSTDHDLMLQVASGQPHKLAELFARHHRNLYAFFRKLGNTRAGSEDLVQDTFFRMLRSAASYRSTGHYTAWMYQIARSCAADAWRSRAKELPVDTEALDEMASSDYGDAELLHNQHETELRLRRALLRLPADKRELVLLSRVRELATADLARLFDCSAPALKVRLHRSLGLLRQYFDADIHGESSAAADEPATTIGKTARGKT